MAPWCKSRGGVCRVLSAVTQEVIVIEAEKLGDHAVCQRFTSGQLLF
jgi:hypothetical protein